MRSILDHESKILFDTDTEPLLTPGFWILPLYRELLNSASRNRPSAASERARGSTGLVKIICKENKEQRGKRKYHDGAPHPKDRGGFTQWFGSCSLINTLYVWFPASWAPMVAERLFEMSSKTGDLSNNTQHGQPARGLSQDPWTPGGMPGANPRTMLLVQVEQRQRRKAMTWCTRSGSGHCQVQLSCLCWMLAAEWPGLSWMTKLFWKATPCCRKASCAMFSRKSVQQHGKVLLDKGLRSPLCCLAAKWQMTGLTSCCRKGTYGPPSLPRGLPQRWLPTKPFAKNGADCRPSIFGWRSRLAGMCCSTECIRRLPLGCLVSNSMTCFSTGLPRAARGIPMKRKHTVVQTTEKSRRGGSKVKSGCGITNTNVRSWSWTLMASYMHPGARKRMLVPRLIHIWITVQSGG